MDTVSLVYVVCAASDELIERFRPNLVVETQEPFVEEHWSSVQIGHETFIVCTYSLTYLLACLPYVDHTGGLVTVSVQQCQCQCVCVNALSPCELTV